MIDYIKNLDAVDCGKILIKNRDQVNAKIKKLIEGGYNKLQVISDYDKTVTKQHVNGKTQLHAFDILKKCPSVPKEVVQNVTELTKKYSVLDKDPNLSHSERMKMMSDWWNKTIEAYKGVKIEQEEINKICLEIGPPIRDNAKDFFDQLKNEDVPVLLLSAGIGEFLEPLLRNSEITGANVELVANYLKLDNAGTIQGYQGPAIHTVNKFQYDIKTTQFYRKVTDRHNVIIMGDHLGDAGMAESLDHLETVLKIGYSYGEAEAVLPTWLNIFDIVLKDDQTMDVPRAIIQLLKKK